MPNSLNELSRVVGGLENAVKSLTDTWKQQDSEATEGRRELHRQVGKLENEVIKLAEAIKPLAELKPDVALLMKARHRQEGAVWLGRLIVAAIAATGGAIGAVLTKWGFK